MGTTILAVKKGGKIAIGGDGQVTLGNAVMKGDAQKIRRLFQKQVVVGFAGAVADSFALMERFEQKLEEHNGMLHKAASELSRDWRTDRVLRRLESMLIAANSEHLLLLSGNGEVIQPSDGILAIGSGGNFALSAARALAEHTDYSAQDVVQKALTIAADICIYTNSSIHIEVIE